MRKFIYILCILSLGGILVYQGFFHMSAQPKLFLENLDFSDTRNLSVVEGAGDETSLRRLKDGEEKNLADDDILYEKLSAFDGIYRFAPEEISVSDVNPSATTVKLASGEYVLGLNSLFKNYTVEGAGFRITPKTPGYFYVKNSPTGPRIYSYNAILTVELLSGKKSITSFELFPSLLFRYDPTYNSDIEKADILRVATINSILYIDSEDPSALSTIIWRDADGQKISKLLSIAKKDITRLLAQYKLLLTELMSNRPESLNGADFIEKYPFLFVNDSKKDIFIKTRLAQELAGVVESTQADKKPGSSSALLELTNELLSTSDNTKKEASETIKIYAQLSFLNPRIQAFESPSSLKDSIFFEMLEKLTDFTPQNSAILPISELFLIKHFEPSLLPAHDAFEKSLNDYLKAVFANLRSIRTEFSYFSFFLSQYLGSGDNLGQYTFSIGSHFITISSTSLENIGSSESTKRDTLLATTLLSYNKICDQISANIKKTFFTQSDKWLVLKDQFLEDGKIKQDILDLESFKSFNAYLASDIAKKQREHPAVTSDNSRDIYASAIESSKTLSHFLDIFNDYSGYLEKLELDPLNQSATKLVDNSTTELSLETLTAYLSQFNGLDLASLSVRNNFKKDGFYDVKVIIRGYVFTFGLDPAGNIIDNVVISDTSWQVLKTVSQSVALDEREKWLRDIYSSADDPIKKHQADFKNFFETNYLSSASVATGTTSQTDATTEMTPQMKTFVQKNLLGDGDFKYLGDFLVVPATSIYATIKDSQYQVDLTDVPLNVSGANDAYLAKISGYYVFAKHAFYKLSFTVNDENGLSRFSGTKIEILPNYLNIQDTKKLLSPLGKYIDMLVANYKPGAKTMKIDLNSHLVSIDSVSLPVTY